ncbi:LysE family translocator [Winogradskyella sp.]|nr:LysE family translocator [Winogradskyella sp.]
MNLISFALLSLLLALSPGPDNLYVLSQSMVHGFKTGLWITLGLILGCLIHTTLLAFGFSVLIDKWPGILIVFRLFGGGYLWYLAYRMIRSSPQLGIDQAGVLSHPWKWFQKGFMLNVSNPKVFLFFVALFPTFLWGGARGYSPSVLCVGGYIYDGHCCSLCWNCIFGCYLRALSGD